MAVGSARCRTCRAPFRCPGGAERIRPGHRQATCKAPPESGNDSDPTQSTWTKGIGRAKSPCMQKSPRRLTRVSNDARSARDRLQGRSRSVTGTSLVYESRPHGLREDRPHGTDSRHSALPCAPANLLASLRCMLLIGQGRSHERRRHEESRASPAHENAGEMLLKEEPRALQISATSRRGGSGQHQDVAVWYLSRPSLQEVRASLSGKVRP
jgi:hypothetical protein